MQLGTREPRVLFGAHLGAFIATLPVVWPVVYPNIEQDEKIQVDHMVLTMSSTKPDQLTVCGDSARNIWLVSVSVRVRAGTGDSLANDTAKALANYTPRFTEFVGVDATYRVEDNANIRPDFTYAGWYTVPVLFRVQAIT